MYFNGFKSTEAGQILDGSVKGQCFREFSLFSKHAMFNKSAKLPVPLSLPLF